VGREIHLQARDRRGDRGKTQKGIIGKRLSLEWTGEEAMIYRRREGRTKKDTYLQGGGTL